MICELLTILTILFILFYYLYNKNTFSLQEHFLPFVAKDDTFVEYLYPTHDDFCKKIGYQTSTGPQLCSNKRNTLYTSNCRCEDDKGNCKVCWPPISLQRKYQ